MSDPILIVGASARAAAMSALRAGFRLQAADLFADQDLCDCCRAVRIRDYPDEFERVLEQHAAATWMYVGGLENDPDLVDRMAAKARLLGNGGAVLRRVRDFRGLFCTLDRAGIAVPKTYDLLNHTAPGEWIVKPKRSCGGNRIRWLHIGGRRTIAREGPGHEQIAQSGASSIPDEAAGFFVQQFVDGMPCGAAYVGDGRRAWLLGVTRPWIPAAWTGARGFQYAGSAGPVRFSRHVDNQFRQLGCILAEQFELIGLFGVDVIVHEDKITVIEVNPRYTSSMEIIERATGVPSMALHVSACRGEAFQPPCAAHGAQHGKAVVYARRATTISRDLRSAIDPRGETAWPVVADVPTVGQQIRAGHPVATVFASSDHFDTLLDRLKARVRLVQRLLNC